MLATRGRKYLIAGLGIALTSFLFFQFFYPYHLFFREQIQLFLFSPDYFLSYFNRPGWMACCAGDFLIQFFYLRGGGPVVLTLLFLVEWMLSSAVIRQISKSTRAYLWALIPVGAEMILFLDLSHSLSTTIGYILTLLFFLLYASISNRRYSLYVGLIVSIGGYWWSGYPALLFPFLALASEAKQSHLSRLIIWTLAGFVTVLIPAFFRHFYHLSLLQAYIFPEVTLTGLFLPATWILILALSLLIQKFEDAVPRLFNFSIPILVLILLGLGIQTRANFRLEKILSLDSEFYFGNNERVIEYSTRYKLKDRVATYFTNMSLAKTGQLPEKLLSFYQPATSGLLLPVSQEESWQNILFSNELFFLAGDMNFAQHSAMLAMTFSPNQRSSRMVKRLAEINLLNDDVAAANKYLRILDKTLFHKKWAEGRMKLHPEGNIGQWLTEKKRQLPHSDTIRKSYDYPASLHYLVEQNPDNLIALDYLLCYHLLNKDLAAFSKDYERYGRLISRPVPSLYSEALLIRLYAGRASREAVMGHAIPPQKINDFVTYTDLFDKTKGDINALQARFGQTYWFYYHFATLKNK